jgi:hypothetical protein
MKKLRATIKKLFAADDEEHTFASRILTELAKWPLPEAIHCRPAMFNGALTHLLSRTVDSHAVSKMGQHIADADAPLHSQSVWES